MSSFCSLVHVASTTLDFASVLINSNIFFAFIFASTLTASNDKLGSRIAKLRFSLLFALGLSVRFTLLKHSAAVCTPFGCVRHFFSVNLLFMETVVLSFKIASGLCLDDTLKPLTDSTNSNSIRILTASSMPRVLANTTQSMCRADNLLSKTSRVSRVVNFSKAGKHKFARLMVFCMRPRYSAIKVKSSLLNLSSFCLY